MAEIQTDARLSFSEIGRRIGLTSPAVGERVKRLEENGVILGYHTQLAPNLTGREVQAIVELTTQTRHYPAIHRLAETHPAIIECHHMTGNISFVFKISAYSLQSLNDLIEELGTYGETQTAIILSSPLVRKNL